MNLQTAIKNPPRALREDRVSGSLLLFGALVAIAVLRRKSLPDQRGLIALLGAAFVIVVSANIAPDVVTWILLVAVIVSIVQNRGTIEQVFNAGVARVQSAVGG